MILKERILKVANTITDIPGIKVGHYTDTNAGTGCTVILTEDGAIAGVDVKGSAPGTRETELLRPMNLVSEIHAVLLSGGSTFGLDAASGVVRYLEDLKIGIEFGKFKIPIVSSAIPFDLELLRGDVRPGPTEGYLACENASTSVTDQGTVGAGTGATVAKLLGMDRAIKGGIGSSSIDLGNGLKVGAIVAVNSLGSIYDPEDGSLIAGPRSTDGSEMYDSMKLITSTDTNLPTTNESSNTTLGIVATNATLTKEQANKLASVAHDGLAMAVRPAHSMNDGDVVFALSTKATSQDVNINQLCAASVLCLSRAILNGVQLARGLGSIPGVGEFKGNDKV